MESVRDIVKIKGKPRPRATKANPHLHSSAHLLADELSLKLNDKKHFGFYLKMAMVHDHAFLRKLAGEVMESESVQTPGRLFAYLIKKHNEKSSK